MKNDVKIEFVPLHPVDFQRLWDTGTLNYLCEGCGAELTAPGWCAECVRKEEERLKAWVAGTRS